MSKMVPKAKKVESFKSLIMPRLKSAIPPNVQKYLTPDRMMRIVLNAFSKTPKLLDCTKESVVTSVLQAAQLGLEMDGLNGEAYLIPYGKECKLLIGYRGLIKMARRSGQISTIETSAVYEGDEFRYERGLNPVLKHVPKTEEPTPENLTHAYAIVRFKDGGVQWDVMTRHEIDQVRARSKASNSGPWVTDYAAMAIKSVLRRMSKLWPMSSEDHRAIAGEELQERGIDPGHTILDADPEPDDTIDADFSDADEPEIDPETGEVVPDPEDLFPEDE